MPVKGASDTRLVLVTAPNLPTARRLARSALETRLIACANILKNVESHYRWKGKLERSSEVLLLLKTTATCLEALEKKIVSLHPYDTPEFLVLKVSEGNARYLAWLAESCSRPSDS